MKTLIITAILSFGMFNTNVFTSSKTTEIENSLKAEKLDIKIKNDTSVAVKVMNAGSGGSYSLTKGATTTIKMEEGDKLHYYNEGKKGDLILTASKEMDGRVQLLSKL